MTAIVRRARSTLASLAIGVLLLAGLALGGNLATAPPAHAGAACFGSQSQTHWHWFGQHLKASVTWIDSRTTREVWVTVVPWPRPPLYVQEFPYRTLTCFH